MEKEVEIGLDQSLACVRFPKCHTSAVGKTRLSLPMVKSMPAHELVGQNSQCGFLH